MGSFDINSDCVILFEFYIDSREVSINRKRFPAFTKNVQNLTIFNAKNP